MGFVETGENEKVLTPFLRSLVDGASMFPRGWVIWMAARGSGRLCDKLSATAP